MSGDVAEGINYLRLACRRSAQPVTGSQSQRERHQRKIELANIYGITPAFASLLLGTLNNARPRPPIICAQAP
jgi:hypothetical protein